MSDRDAANEHWHLDKRVPISLIFTILVQTAFFAWFLSGLNARVENNEQHIASIEAEATAQDQRVRTNTTSLAAIENAMETQNAILLRIDHRTARFERYLDNSGIAERNAARSAND